jgi:hypothetical protein
MNKIMFTTSKGLNLTLDKEFIENVMYNRDKVSGEILTQKEGLLIDRIGRGDYLIMDLDYQINKTLHDKYSISEDDTKQWGLVFINRTTDLHTDLNGALTTIKYKGKLPITDLSYVFMKIVNMNSSKIGISQSPDQPYLYVSRTSEGANDTVDEWHRVLYNNTVFKRGSGINYDSTTSLFSISQPGLYLVSACIWCPFAATTIALQLQFKQVGLIPWLIHSKNTNNNVHVVGQIYLSPSEYNFPITNLCFEWLHDSPGGILAYAGYPNSNTYTYAQISFIG